MVLRVGVIAVLILGLVGYAMKVTYEMVIQGGVVPTGDAYKVDLKAMSNFEMSQNNGTVQDVPERFRSLDGKKVILEGEVAPGGLTAGNKADQLVICYSVAKCCITGQMKIQHFVVCRPPAGKSLNNFSVSDTIKVYGTLHVKVKQDGGVITSIFQLDVDRIDPVG